MTEVSKISEKTRDLVRRASTARNVLVKDVTERYAKEAHVEVDTDILCARLSMALKALDDTNHKPNARKSAETYEADALTIIGKKTLTKTVIVDDQTRTKAEQDLYHAADVWMLRLKTEAGVKTQSKQGGNRTPKPTSATPMPKATIVDPDNAPHVSDASPTFNVSVPKPKASSDLGTAIMALASAAEKLLAEASQTHAIDGDLGACARDALAAIIKAGKAFNASSLALTAKKDDAPKGAKRAAVIAQAKAHAPVVELPN